MSKEVKEQAIKLEKYIKSYATRECNVANALGQTGYNMLDKLFELVYDLEED